MIFTILFYLAPSTSLLFLWLYNAYGRFYAEGSAEYASLNNVFPHKENFLHSIKDESKELFYAILSFSLKETIMEFYDVLHSIMKYLVIKFLPERFFCSKLCWALVFPLVLPCSIKLAMRYKNYRCIRNHQNKNNCQHLCNYSLVNKKE